MRWKWAAGCKSISLKESEKPPCVFHGRQKHCHRSLELRTSYRTRAAGIFHTIRNGTWKPRSIWPEELQECNRAFSQQQDEALPMATKGAHISTISACSTHWEHLPCPKKQVPVHQALPPLHPTLSCSCNAFSPSSLAWETALQVLMCIEHSVLLQHLHCKSYSHEDALDTTCLPIWCIWTLPSPPRTYRCLRT